MSKESYSPFHRFPVNAPAHPVGGQWQGADELSSLSPSSPVASLNIVSDVAPNQQSELNAHNPSSTSNLTSHFSQMPTSKSPTEQLMRLAELQMMANRLGIPSMLPKPPSSSITSTVSPPSTSPPAAVVMESAQSYPPAGPSTVSPDFQSTLQGYLSMLSQQPPTASTPSTFVSPLPIDGDVDNAGIAVENRMASPGITIQNTVVDNAIASPYPTYLTSPETVLMGDEFLASPIFSDILGDEFTSPLMSDITSPVSPLYDQFNTSPGMDSPLAEFLNTPIMDAVDQVAVEGADEWAPLFDDAAQGAYKPFEQQKAVETTAAGTSGTASPPTTVSPSDMTPTVSPPMSMSPPLATETRSSSHGQSRSQPKPQLQRRFVPNGTRKGVTPDSLVPYDAPIQSRRTTSSSSSKRRKTETAAVPTGVDQELDGPEVEDNDEERKRAAKRERNTLAARTSRKRKLEHQLRLQEDNDRLTAEIQQWKTRAEVMEGMLKANGWQGSMWEIKA